MPTKVHDGLINLIRDRPAFAAELLADALHINLPEHTTVRLQSADCTHVTSTEFRADAVVALDGSDKTAAAIVTEIQTRRDPDKRFSWPVYLTTLRARLRCPVMLLVISPSRQIAAWSAKPIDCGHPGFTLRPFTIGPDQIPEIVDPALAAKSPELTLLSAMAHGRIPDNPKPLDSSIIALARFDEDRRRIYYDITLALLPEASRTYLEKLMSDNDYVFQSDFALRNQAQGRVEALLTVLAARGIAVSDSLRDRITGCRDLAQLDRWVTKALTAKTAQELFA